MNELAFRLVQQITGQVPKTLDPELSSERAKAGRKGGLKGGKARAELLSPEERSRIAKKAASTRWGKQSGGETPS
jgi:hypothetical protein